MEKVEKSLDRLTLEEAVAEMHRIGEADPKYVKGYAEGYYGKREENPYSASPYVRGIQAGRAARIREAHDALPLHPARAHGANTEPTKKEKITVGQILLLIVLLPAMLGGALVSVAWIAIQLWAVWIVFAGAGTLGLLTVSQGFLSR